MVIDSVLEFFYILGLYYTGQREMDVSIKLGWFSLVQKNIAGLNREHSYQKIVCACPHFSLGLLCFYAMYIYIYIFNCNWFLCCSVYVHNKRQQKAFLFSVCCPVNASKAKMRPGSKFAISF